MNANKVLEQDLARIEEARRLFDELGKEKNRKEMLMAYGNAIVPQAGAHVIKAFMEYAT